MRILVGFFLLIACSAKKLEWNSQVLTKIDMKPFVFDIPPGWRDISESKLPALSGITKQLGANAHMIVRANDANTDTNIAFMWADAAPTVTCQQIVDAMSAQGSEIVIDKTSVVSESLGGDTGCSYRFKDQSSVGTSWMRMKGSRFFTMQCIHEASGDADADATCARFAAALKAQ